MKTLIVSLTLVALFSCTARCALNNITYTNAPLSTFGLNADQTGGTLTVSNPTGEVLEVDVWITFPDTTKKKVTYYVQPGGELIINLAPGCHYDIVETLAGMAALAVGTGGLDTITSVSS